MKIICNKLYDTIKYFKTGIKDFEKIYILYDDNKFSICNDTPSNDIYDSIDEKMGPVHDTYYTLSRVINYDIKPDNLIYNTFLS